MKSIHDPLNALRVTEDLLKKHPKPTSIDVARAAISENIPPGTLNGWLARYRKFGSTHFLASAKRRDGVKHRAKKTKEKITNEALLARIINIETQLGITP